MKGFTKQTVFTKKCILHVGYVEGFHAWYVQKYVLFQNVPVKRDSGSIADLSTQSFETVEDLPVVLNTPMALAYKGSP